MGTGTGPAALAPLLLHQHTRSKPSPPHGHEPSIPRRQRHLSPGRNNSHLLHSLARDSGASTCCYVVPNYPSSRQAAASSRISTGKQKSRDEPCGGCGQPRHLAARKETKRHFHLVLPLGTSHCKNQLWSRAYPHRQPGRSPARGLGNGNPAAREPDAASGRAGLGASAALCAPRSCGVWLPPVLYLHRCS